MKASAPATYTALIKEKAAALGFAQCGVAKAGFLEEEAPRLEAWLKGNMHGQMHYMANHFDKRLDPTQLVPGAKSVISLLYNYYPAQDLGQSSHYKIAKYAYGTDYHFVIKDKLRELLTYIQETIGEVDGRAFVDSAPVMERQWAQKSGLGWLGKNSLLLNKQKGSFFFLAELILDLELQPDLPLAKDFCGNCTRCMDACPTEAIVKPGVVNGSQCISYFTIELKEAIPKEVAGRFENWVFGCDICQDVCPWNRFSSPHKEAAFHPHPDMPAMKKDDWEDISREVFNKIFKKSAVKRTKYEGFKRNLSFVQQKNEEDVKT